MIYLKNKYMKILIICFFYMICIHNYIYAIDFNPSSCKVLKMVNSTNYEFICSLEENRINYTEDQKSKCYHCKYAIKKVCKKHLWPAKQCIVTNAIVRGLPYRDNQFDMPVYQGRIRTGRSISQISDIISHDLNNPVSNTIIGYTGFSYRGKFTTKKEIYIIDDIKYNIYYFKP